MVKWKEIELGFRTNPNKSLCMGYNPYLSCLEIIQEKFFFEDTHVMKDELCKIEMSR